MENNTWIKLFRKFREWEWYKDSNVSRLFIHLLLSVNYEDKKWQGIEIKRGDIVIGIEDFGIQIGLTRQQTRSALNKLKSTNEITIKTTNKFTVVTINKFNDYQQITNKPTNEQPTNNQQITTTKEYKELKKEKKDIIKGKTYTKDNLTIKEMASKFSEVFTQATNRSGSFPSTCYDNLDFWLGEYDPNEIAKAIKNIPHDEFWNDKMTLTILFRKKGPHGEPVDYISNLLSVKKTYE